MRLWFTSTAPPGRGSGHRHSWPATQASCRLTPAPADSVEWYDKAINTLTPVQAKEPRDVAARSYLRNSHGGRAQTYDRLGKQPKPSRTGTRRSISARGRSDHGS